MRTTTGNPRTQAGDTPRWSRRAKVLGVVTFVALALVATGCGALMMPFHHSMGFDAGSRPTGEREYGFGDRLSKTGLYRVRAETPEPIRVGRIHEMRVHVETADGRPAEDATLSVDGGMPDHGHGLPTQPRVTANLGAGEYLVEGMKYNMGGWWVVRVSIESESGADEVVFNLNL